MHDTQSVYVYIYIYMYMWYVYIYITYIYMYIYIYIVNMFLTILLHLRGKFKPKYLKQITNQIRKLEGFLKDWK